MAPVHMNGRVYDPSTGRMISADPTVPDPLYTQAFNRYAYVYNNPMNSIDPSGFYAEPSFLLGPMGPPCPACNWLPPWMYQAAPPNIQPTPHIDLQTQIMPGEESPVNNPTSPDPSGGTSGNPGNSDPGGNGGSGGGNSDPSGNGDSSGNSQSGGFIVGGAQCNACTAAAFGKIAGPGALDGMGEDPPKSPTPVIPQTHGSGAVALIGHDALRNLPHTPGTIVGPIGSHGTGGTGGAIRPIWPTYSPFITSHFGPRGCVAGSCNSHNGIDIHANYGVPITAPESGKVLQLNWTARGGNQVFILGYSGLGYGFAHIQPSSGLTVNSTVTVGQVIGDVAHSGTETGPHVHFSVIINPIVEPDGSVGGQRVDPMQYFGGGP